MSTIQLTAAALQALDLSPADQVLQALQSQADWMKQSPQLRFEIDYPRESTDPRELSEIPEVRLWFIRLDAAYAWLPLFLDWKGGELGRYVAMLLPHQFHPTEGVQYNPEALEIWVMHRVFWLEAWLRDHGATGTAQIKGMTQMLGYELDDAFFTLLNS